jgi:flagellar basal-body rod modification protein FlgD
MSTVSSVSNYSSNNSTSTDTLSSSSQTLSQKDFLQLLVTQMENQNPLDPQSDTQMAAEMAQFTSLQQSSSMSSSLSMMQANSLIGSTVNLQVDSGTTTSGVVSGVVMNSGTPLIMVGGSTYNLNQVLSVSPSVTNTTSSGSDSTAQ